jgi:hypothetical protein
MREERGSQVGEQARLSGATPSLCSRSGNREKRERKGRMVREKGEFRDWGKGMMLKELAAITIPCIPCMLKDIPLSKILRENELLELL